MAILDYERNEIKIAEEELASSAEAVKSTLKQYEIKSKKLLKEISDYKSKRRRYLDSFNL